MNGPRAVAATRCANQLATCSASSRRRCGGSSRRGRGPTQQRRPRREPRAAAGLPGTPAETAAACPTPVSLAADTGVGGVVLLVSGVTPATDAMSAEPVLPFGTAFTQPWGRICGHGVAGSAQLGLQLCPGPVDVGLCGGQVGVQLVLVGLRSVCGLMAQVELVLGRLQGLNVLGVQGHGPLQAFFTRFSGLQVRTRLRQKSGGALLPSRQ